MSGHLPERQAVIDLYDGELDTAHSQMCSTDFKECCQPSRDDFVKALDHLMRRVHEAAWRAGHAEGFQRGLSWPRTRKP